MNILILNWKDGKNPDAGGAEILVANLTKGLVRDGHSVTWFCREFPGCVKEEIMGITKIIRRGNRLTVYLEAWKYVNSLKNKPDLIIESINTLCWLTPLYVPKHKRVVLVNQLAKEVFFYELPPVVSHIAFALERWEYLFYRTSNIVCFSKSVKNDLISFGIPKSSIATFPIGLDHNRYVSGTKSKTPLFVFVGRLARMKRADLCVQAMKLVTAAGVKGKLVIIGSGPEAKPLKDLIRKLKLRRQVRVIVGLNEQGKIKFMQRAWALLLPSVKEGWGMVVTEAAACSTPSVVTNVSGLQDAVLNEKTGFILSRNPSPEELSEKILEIIKNRRLREKLSKNSLLRAKEFSWEKCYQGFKKAIKL